VDPFRGGGSCKEMSSESEHHAESMFCDRIGHYPTTGRKGYACIS